MLSRLRVFLSLLFFVLGIVVLQVQNSAPMAVVGDVRDVPLSDNSLELDLGRFAVEEHNKKSNAQLVFQGVVSHKEQVVAGTKHIIVVEVVDGEDVQRYEATIWERAWLKSKELQAFKYLGNYPSAGKVKGGDGAGKAAIHAAAMHAVRTIQERSNSLSPYDLQEVVQADIEEAAETSKFDMVLKVKRGNKEEQFKVVVNRNKDGVHHLGSACPHP